MAATGGRAGADMNTDFFEEIEVKTGGYLPEFGRSTGGIFNLVLRSGSNDLHGEVFANISPGFLRANPTPIYRAGEAIAETAELLAVKAVLIGTSKRTPLWKLLRGSVLRDLKKALPDGIELEVVQYGGPAMPIPLERADAS